MKSRMIDHRDGVPFDVLQYTSVCHYRNQLTVSHPNRDPIPMVEKKCALIRVFTAEKFFFTTRKGR
jgi:hypothetical protein